MTKRQATRYERDQRWSKIVFWGCIGALALVVAIPLIGYLWENVYRANEAIAAVYGKKITVAEYARVLGYKQALLDSQQQQMEQMVNQRDPNDPQGGMIQNIAQQQLQQIRQQRAGLEGQTVEDMMNAELVRHEAKARGITITPAEMDEALVDEFGARQPQASAAPDQAQSGQDSTPPGVTPATPEEIQKAKDTMRNTLRTIKILPEQEFTYWILEPDILKKKLNNELAQNTPRVVEQVHARHILVDTQNEAQAVIDRLNNGEDFAAVAAEVSKDTSNKDQGGDLGWFPRGQMVKEFETIAFSAPLNEISRPVRTQFGYHVIQVLERGERELTDDQYTQAKTHAVDKWLDEQRANAGDRPENAVAYYIGSSKTLWARDYINRNLNKKIYGG